MNVPTKRYECSAMDEVVMTETRGTLNQTQKQNYVQKNHYFRQLPKIKLRTGRERETREKG